MSCENQVVSKNDDSKNESKNLTDYFIRTFVDSLVKELKKGADNPKLVINFYYIYGDPGNNKSSVGAYSINGKKRLDFTNNTTYKLYNTLDNKHIGECLMLYNKIQGEKDFNFYVGVKSYLFYENTIMTNSIGATMLQDAKKLNHILPKIEETSDFNGNRIIIEKLDDDINSPEKALFRATFY